MTASDEEELRTSEIQSLNELAWNEFIADLVRRGVPVKVFGDIYKNQPFNSDFVNAFLEWVLPETNQYILTTILIWLSKTRGTFDGDRLVSLWRNSQSKIVRERVSFTITGSKVKIPNNVILNLFEDSSLGDDRYQLLSVISRRFPKEAARKLVLDSFDIQPWLAAKAIRNCGTRDDVEFLSAGLSHWDSDTRNEIKKSIAKLST